MPKGRVSFNPAEVLFLALDIDGLDSRVIEALPWLPFHFPDLNWQWLIRRDSAYGPERPTTDLDAIEFAPREASRLSGALTSRCGPLQPRSPKNHAILP